jgi:hypothetical protein
MAKDGIIWLVKQYHGYTIHKKYGEVLGDGLSDFALPNIIP